MPTPTNRRFSKMDWLKRITGLKGASLQVLVAVYNHTDALGRNAFPGLKLLSEETGLRVPTVSTTIQTLKADGWIREVEKGSNLARRNSVYELVPDAPKPPDVSAVAEPVISARPEVSVSAVAEANQILYQIMESFRSTKT